MNYRKIFTIGVAILAICALSVPAALAVDIVEPGDVLKYSNDLPVIKDLGLRIDMTGGGKIKVEMRETMWSILGAKTASGTFPMTTVWGYKFPGFPTTYPGATIVAQEGVPIRVKWANELPNDGHVVTVDTTLHMAKSMKTLPQGRIPVVAHLHGGHTESGSDGLPEQWFTQNWADKGPTWARKTFSYDNDQEGATLWYHDHALGITRLNVYAGLAGFYLLRDDNENSLIDTNVLPSGDEEIEIVFQDRFFLDDGSLLMPAFCDDPGAAGALVAEFVTCPAASPNDPGGANFPTAIAEFFGDIMVVNGAAWPKLAVDKGKYRLRLLNGSDSRFYVLQFRTDPTGSAFPGTPLPFLVIGNDNGFLNTPVTPSYEGNSNTLLVAPGERYDVVIDTTTQAGNSFYLRNFGPDEPFGGGTPGSDFDIADVNSTGQLMRFDVSTNDAPVASVIATTDLRVDIPDLQTPSATANPRQLALFEGLDEFGRLQPLLGTVDLFPDGENNGTLTWFQKITENPALNATETWEVFNATGDAHPIHLHLVSFRIIDRQPWDIETEPRDQLQHNGEIGEGANIDISGGQNGALRTPPAYEAGRKDTAVMLPDERTRVVATFDRPGRYVWHCHILSHEDHEMMRPFCVGDLTKQNCGPLGDEIVVPDNG